MEEMETVIEAWYRGERVPARQPLPQTERTLSLEREIRALERRLSAMLTEEQAALYALLRDREAEAASGRESAIFAQGVRLGARLYGRFDQKTKPEILTEQPHPLRQKSLEYTKYSCAFLPCG